MANKSINTHKYATYITEQFVNGVTSDTTQLYLAVGRPEEWTANEPNPDTPTADTQNVDYAVWRDMLGAKRISSNNVSIVVERKNWTSSTIYAQYDDTDADLFSKDFYVVDQASETDYYYVYKCLWNNSGAVSTVSPATNVGSSLIPITLSDGYVWKYLYRIEPSQEKFMTATWMPVYANTTISTDAVANGGRLSIEVPIIVNSGGAGYNPSSINTITTTIDGDGRNASIVLSPSNFTGNAVTNLAFANGGFGYTKVDTLSLSQIGVTTSANLRAIIPPHPNHGYDPINELGATGVMISTELEYDENAKLTTVNDYRRVMLLANPQLPTGNVANGDFYRQTYDCVIASNTGTFVPDDIITVSNTAYAVTGRVVDVVTENASTVMRITDVNDKGRTGLVVSANAQIAFMPGDTVTKSGKSATFASTNTAISVPELEPFTGQIIYVNHHTTITRKSNKIEQFKIVFQFGS
jgi:hypothetical protein